MATQETNQLDERVNHQLLAILKDMVVNIVRPDNHYMVSASSIEFLDEQRAYRRQYLCPIYVHQDAAWSIDFDEEGILLDVVMAPGPNIPRERIRIAYPTIYSVAKNDTGGLFHEKDLLFYDRDRFTMPPLS